MSSADDFAPQFDDWDNEAPPPPPPPPAEDITWLASGRAKKSGKKKGKKGRKYVDTLPEPDEGEDIPFARAITSSSASPPAHPLSPLDARPPPPDAPAPSGAEFYGVSLDDEDFPPDHAALDDSSAPSSPPLHPVKDDTPPAAQVEAAVKSTPVSPPPAVRSPRALPAKPSPLSSSPATRQTPLYGSPPAYSSSRAHRSSTSSSTNPAPPRRDFHPAYASPRSQFVEPAAAPHKAQPHFYGLPDLDLNLGMKKEQNSGKTAGADGYCCCFDSFADSGDEVSSRKARDALLVGSEGGLEVFRILPKQLEVVGRLEGLRGGVIGAKILPYTELQDPLQEIRPLVVVIVHGVMVDERCDSSLKQDGRKERSQDESAHYYQTTVEVYSLQTQEHVATLYKSLPALVEQPTFGQLSSLPEPIGDLQITAQGKFVLLASGKSGEAFLFTNAANAVNPEGQFRCIGKFWTSLQSPLDTPSARPPSAGETGQNADENDHEVRVPLLSLTQRWLALAPPSTSSYVSIQGSPALSEQNPNPPGLASAVAPPQPSITCDIVGADDEDAWSRLTRQAAKGVVKYSQKGIDLGWQGWKELTNPTPQQHGRTPSREHAELFPPTNAPPDDPRRVHKEPAIISVVDLAALLEAEEMKLKYPPAPMSTFALKDGCNYLSFSRSGLLLLTVSRKGDISTVWDLSHSYHGNPRINCGYEDYQGFGNDPCVKLVHRITRNSPSMVVDCAWTRDDEYLALLTTHGTIHLHEIPARSPSRKRKRRTTSAAAPPAPEKAQPVVGVSHESSPPSSAGGGFLSSIKSSWQQMSSQVHSFRSQQSNSAVSGFGIPTTFAGFREVTASAGQAGGRVLAKGLSQGLSAAKGGVGDYWHADDNKIRHKALALQGGHERDGAGAGSLQWIKRQSEFLLAVVCGGTVHLHPVQRVERRKGEVLVSGLKHDKYGLKHFALPSIRTRAAVGDVVVNGQLQNRKAKEKEDADSCAKQGPHGFWSLKTSPTMPNDMRRPVAGSSSSAPLLSSQANEVESNPPYCPFHIDPRVDIFAFDGKVMDSQMDFDDDDDDDPALEAGGGDAFLMHGHGLDGDEDDADWIFGEPLPPSTKMNTHDEDHLSDMNHREFHADDSDGDDVGVDSLAEQMESAVTVRTSGKDDSGRGGEEEIRINTRRAQVRPSEPNDDDDDGEFEVLGDGDSGSGG